MASAYLIPNILLLPVLYAALDPSSNTFPWLVAMYIGMGVSDPDLWRLLARVTYYDDEEEDRRRRRNGTGWVRRPRSEVEWAKVKVKAAFH